MHDEGIRLVRVYHLICQISFIWKKKIMILVQHRAFWWDSVFLCLILGRWISFRLAVDTSQVSSIHRLNFNGDFGKQTYILIEWNISKHEKSLLLTYSFSYINIAFFGIFHKFCQIKFLQVATTTWLNLHAYVLKGINVQSSKTHF